MGKDISHKHQSKKKARVGKGDNWNYKDGHYSEQSQNQTVGGLF